MLNEEFAEDDESFDPSTLPPFYVRKLNGFLRTACKRGHLVCVDLLVEKGADIDHIDREDNTTVLQAAILHGQFNIIEYLIDKASDKTRKTAHVYAVERYKQLEEVLKLFHKKDSSFALPSSSLSAQTAGPSKSVTVVEETKTNVIPTPTKDKSDEASAQKIETLSHQIQELQRSNDELQKQLEALKKERSDLNTQAEKLNSDLKAEKKQREEVQGHFEDLHKELATKEEEIVSVKHERDNERRAKENAKRILSLDNMSIPLVITPNPLFNLGERPRMPRGSKSIVDLTQFDIQGKGNRLHTTKQDLKPNGVKMEGSKDDLEIHNLRIDNKVKDRVRKLVRTWEEMTFDKKLSNSAGEL